MYSDIGEFLTLRFELVPGNAGSGLRTQTSVYLPAGLDITLQ